MLLVYCSVMICIGASYTRLMRCVTQKIWSGLIILTGYGFNISVGYLKLPFLRIIKFKFGKNMVDNERDPTACVDGEKSHVSLLNMSVRGV